MLPERWDPDHQTDEELLEALMSEGYSEGAARHLVDVTRGRKVPLVPS